ncbi:MAG: transglutaminase-like domain-containing protein [Acutalibacteraceae bacterium]|nr:transglutaminase-like domain-containing protein [Acutalibacteraceae bacterium]
MQKFLQATEYIDYNSEIIQQKALELFTENMSNTEKARIAYEFVRDEIPHSFDCNAKIITAKASDVLKYKTGICHAKANLLASLLRLEGIPTGFCFQRLTLLDDDSIGYGVHAYNAVFLENKWIKLDARGNKKGVNAQFSMGEPILAFPVRADYDECFYKGIYAYSHMPSMQMLEKAKSIQDIRENIPDVVTEKPDIQE